jgi:hypothetical protein
MAKGKTNFFSWQKEFALRGSTSCLTRTAVGPIHPPSYFKKRIFLGVKLLIAAKTKAAPYRASEAKQEECESETQTAHAAPSRHHPNFLRRDPRRSPRRRRVPAADVVLLQLWVFSSAAPEPARAGRPTG